ncbi:MAG: carboxymuconolactone decarboxylase family protein [Bacteriovorax sp.]|nr:carboxymuconolactone decarboxylase family protein [Bacteriovorax sp.]
MKIILTIFTLTIFSIGMTANAALIKTTSSEAKSTYHDIQKTLGIVPTFMKAYPEEGISAAWEEFKSVQLNTETQLTGKEKELIGLGVAAQIPCKYCVYFHTEAAKLNGATDKEIKETIAIAANTRHWSTYLNGIQYNEADFQKETDKVVAFVKKRMDNPNKKTDETSMQPIIVTDPITAYQDIELTLGSVPNFFRLFPQDGISGAWKMMKSIQLNPNTELSGKVKELIGLGVSAQVPCKFCTYFHTETAKLNGASSQEIREALAMASLSRFWSTVLNGSQIDEVRFKKEVGVILKYVKTQNTKRVGMNTK